MLAKHDVCQMNIIQVIFDSNDTLKDYMANMILKHKSKIVDSYRLTIKIV